MADWITAAAVAERVDLEATEPDVISSTAAVRAAVEERRSELDYTDELTVPAHVREGAILWAVLLVQLRSSPGGFQGYDAESAIVGDGQRRAEIRNLLGWNRPVTA